MKGLSKETSSMIEAAALAQCALLSKPYLALAQGLAVALAGAKVQTDAAKKAKSGTWAGFKSAIAIARESGHSASVMRTGLEVACVEAGIPAGSFRGYISTIESLAAEVIGGTMTTAEVEAISVKDARARYMPEDKKALAAAHAKLAETVKDWTAEQILLLVEIATADTASEDADTDTASDEAETPEPQVANG
jgi:hypothetical protein